MKSSIYFLIVIFFIHPSLSFAASVQCSLAGYTITTINGIFTDDVNARKIKDALEYKLGKDYKGETLKVDYLYNPSHLAGVGDIAKSIQQGLFDSETIEDYDLVEMLRDASEKVATQKLLIVAHSQGNFYANSFYDMVADKTGGAPAESIGVYSVATPSSRVAGGGKWLTSDTDKTIAGVVGHIPFRKIMEPNTHIELQNGDDFWGHGFLSVYLKYQSEKIISDIRSSLDQLKTNDIQDAQKPCFAPPKLSLAHKIQGGVFAFADPIASGIRFVAFELPAAVGQYTERVMLAAAETAASAVTKAVGIGTEKIVEAAQIIKQTFSEAFKRDEFQLAQIANLSEAQSDQSGQAVQASDFKQCSFNAQKSPSRLKVIINEVAWMGGASSANDEWIELKNISGSPLDISGYQLFDKNEQIKIVFEKKSIIPADGFYLLERTDDAVVPEIKADVVYSGILSNTNEELRLFDGGCDLIDEASASPNWPAGDNTAKRTMERNSGDSNWHASAVIGGTPKKENSQSVVVKKQETAINNLEAMEESEIQELNQEISTSTSAENQISNNQIAPQICSFASDQLPSRQKIVINETAWMGTINSANDEWIELKNISGAEINLNGYQLIDQGGQIKITFESGDKIPADRFYLLERTDDDAVPNLAADKIYTGALSNTNEGLRLFDGNCGLIDEVLASPDWPAGDNLQKRSMERSPSLSWHNYNGLAQDNILGTPKAENSAPTISSSGGGGSGSATSEQQPIINNAQQQELKVLINEIQIYPTGERFVELYNPNNSAVNLTNWYIQRKTQSGSSFGSLISKTYFENKTIDAYGYFLISRVSLENTDIILDNLTITESNTIQIKNSSGEVIDKIGWGNSGDCENNCALEPSTGQSIQRSFQDNAFFDSDNNVQDFEIQSCPSPKARSRNCQQAQAPTEPAGAYHIVISEIYPDKTGYNSDFVELYNPTDSLVSLKDYSLKILKEGATSTTSLASFSSSNAIAAKSFFLVGLGDYNGTSTPADISRTSNLLTTQTAAIILYNADNLMDEVNYNPASFVSGQSLERKSLSGGSCVSAQNDGEFLGNGCDTGNDDDFEIRQIPNPQNSFNLPEFRSAPTTPSDFSIQYSSSTMKLIFNWDASQDYNNATSTIYYKITDISDSSSTLATIDAVLAKAEISINERGRSYGFYIQAFDRDGLGSLKSKAEIDIPPIKQTILVQQLDDTAQVGSDQAIIQKLSLSPSEFQGFFNRIELKVFSDDGYNYMHSVWIKEINPDNASDYALLFYTNYADLGPPKQWNTIAYDVGNITTKSDKIYEFAVRGRFGGLGDSSTYSNLKVKGSPDPNSYPYGNADGIADLYFKIYSEE